MAGTAGTGNATWSKAAIPTPGAGFRPRLRACDFIASSPAAGPAADRPMLACGRSCPRLRPWLTTTNRRTIPHPPLLPGGVRPGGPGAARRRCRGRVSPHPNLARVLERLGPRVRPVRPARRLGAKPRRRRPCLRSSSRSSKAGTASPTSQGADGPILVEARSLPPDPVDWFGDRSLVIVAITVGIWLGAVLILWLHLVRRATSAASASPSA